MACMHPIESFLPAMFEGLTDDEARLYERVLKEHRDAVAPIGSLEWHLQLTGEEAARLGLAHASDHDAPPIGSLEWHAGVQKLIDEWRARPRTMTYDIVYPARAESFAMEVKIGPKTHFSDDVPEESQFVTRILAKYRAEAVSEEPTRWFLNYTPFTGEQVEAAAAVIRAKPCPDCMGSKVLRGFTSADRPCPCSTPEPEPELGPSEWTMVERKDDVTGDGRPMTIATFRQRSETLTVKVWPGSELPHTLVGTTDYGRFAGSSACCVLGEVCFDMALARVESGLRRGTITARDPQ